MVVHWNHAQLAFLVLEITVHQGLKNLITALNGKDKFSETLSYGRLSNMVTLLWRPLFFGRLEKTAINFLVKKPSLIWKKPP